MYNEITERSEELFPWWKRLDEVKFEDMDKMDLNIPGGLIMYRDEPYILLDVKKRIKYSPGWTLDDIEFDVHESGLDMNIELIKCGSGEIEKLSIYDHFSDKSCLEVFDEHRIKIPDKKTRIKVSQLYRNSLCL